MDIMVVINQMVQLFIVIALGYILNKIGIFDSILNKKLTTLLLNVTTPALVLDSVLSNDNTSSLSEVGMVFLVSFAIFAILPIISFLLVKIMRIPKKQQGLYMFMTVFSNVGFMGFPVMKAIFGNEAVFYTAIFNMGFNLLVFTLGIVMMSYGSQEKIQLDIKKVLSPGVVASIFALIIYFTHMTFPSVIANTCSMVGNITTPIAMLLIGSTLASMPIKEVFNDLRVYPYAIIKQIILPMLLFPVMDLLIADKFLLGISFIMVSMPVANSAVLFATEYGGDVKLAAKTIFMTTLLSVATIPMMVYMYLI